MNIIAFFSSAGTPSTGLTPKINVWTVAGANVVNEQDMTEIAGGFYTYDFTTYDEDEDYVIRADGVTLTGYDRYVHATNQTAGVGKILQIEKGNWEIKGNKMIFYDTDGITELYSYNLQTKNGSPTERDIFKRLVT